MSGRLDGYHLRETGLTQESCEPERCPCYATLVEDEIGKHVVFF